MARLFPIIGKATQVVLSYAFRLDTPRRSLYIPSMLMPSLEKAVVNQRGKARAEMVGPRARAKDDARAKVVESKVARARKAVEKDMDHS